MKLKNNKKNKDYHFTNQIKKLCWQKADKIPGRDPYWFRYDVIGNPVFKGYSSCKKSAGCYNYDHIIPKSKGGDSTVDNC